MRITRTEQVEQASARILASGTPRQRELRAYLLARGRFAEVVTLAATLAPVTPRLSLVA